MKQYYQHLIQEWRARPLPHIVPRALDIANYLDPALRKIVTVTGFRRVGKTYLLLDYASHLGQKNCIYLNLEDERIPEKTESLTLFSDSLAELGIPENTVLLLDEIQNIPNWSKWARRMNETTKYQLILTGSSSELTYRKLPTELRGRSLNMQVNTLTFTDFINFKGKSLPDLPQQQILALLHEFLTFGGLPEIVLADEGRKYLLLAEYLKTFITRDIIERYHIRKEHTLGALIDLLINSTEFTASKLANTLESVDSDISRSTVQKYITYLQESFFLQSLLWHDASAKNRMQAPRKTYFVDSFFISSSSGFSNNTGRLMEQKVYEKLQSVLMNNPAYNLYYWRNQQRYEVDFVLREKERTIRLIQVSYIRQGGTIPEREVRNLALAAKHLNCKDLILVTWDMSGEHQLDGYHIRLVPLVEFLTVESIHI